MTQSPPTGELVARLRAMNPWTDMDWPEVVKAAADRLEASTTLERELEEARATNRELHRRVQAQESEEAQQLRMIKYHEGNRLEKMWSGMWKQEFDRLLSAHNELKLIYEICAKALNLPYGKYHSVMDSRFGKKSPDDRPREVFANVFIDYPKGGIEAFSVVRSAEALNDAITASQAEVERLKAALAIATPILSQYVDFIRRVPSANIEEHPYLPSVEEAIDIARAALQAEESKG